MPIPRYCEGPSPTTYGVPQSPSKPVRAIARIALALLVTLSACNPEEQLEEELALSQIDGFHFAIYGQRSTSREWKEIDVDTVAILGMSDDHLLYNPLGISGRVDGGSYITDYGDFLIKRFNVAGQLVGTYGQGQGEGPGEFQNPMDPSIDEAGNVVVPDAYRLAVSRFGPKGDLLETNKLDFQPFRMTLTEDGRYYFMPRGYNADGRLFGIADAPGKPLFTFGTSDLHFLVLGGEITTVDNDLVYSPLYFGFIARFSDSSEVVYARETLDQVDPPEVVPYNMEGWPTMFRRGVSVPAKSFLAYSNGKLYMDSLPLSREREATVIDVYSADDGSYDYSFEVPGRWRSMDLAGDYFFALSDTLGTVLRLRP